MEKPHADNGGMRSDDESKGWEAARLLGETLRALRQQHGLAQTAVAQSAGITRNHYALLEQGQSSAGGPANPRLSTLIAMADTFGVPLTALIAELDGLD